MYFHDLAKHGRAYKSQVPNPEEIIIKQSRAYRMRYPLNKPNSFVSWNAYYTI
jgi:hypothetical protein